MNNTLTISFTLLLLLLPGCGDVSGQLYPVGSRHVYLLTVADSAGKTALTDTLTMDVTRPNLFMKLAGIDRKAVWTNADGTHKETRGLHDGETLELQVPFDYPGLETIIVAPYPDIMLPPNYGSSSESTHSFGYGVLAGKTIKQASQMLDTSMCTVYDGSRTTCWHEQGRNTSLIETYGEHIIDTWFTTRHGFTKWVYAMPDGRRATFQLIGRRMK